MLIQQPAWRTPAYRQGKTSNENDCLPACHHLRDRRRDVFRYAGRPIADLMPGYSAGSSLIHMKHAIAAAVAAVVLFAIGWFMGRR